VVGVEKSKMQVRREHLADGGFAGAHETDEGDVLNLARAFHGKEFNDSQRDGTPFLRLHRSGRQIVKSNGLSGCCCNPRARSHKSATVRRSMIFTTASRTSFITLRMAQRDSSGQEHFS